MKKVYIFIGLFLSIVLSGCSSTKISQLPIVDEDNYVTVYVYRTKSMYQRFGLEKPFVYMDETLIAKLGTGGYRTTRVPIGKHTLNVKESMFFMPSYSIAKIEFTAEKGKVYYFRFSREAAGVVGTTVTSSSKLTMVDEESFLGRL